jgi:heparinase II/III-like protein
MENKMLFIYSQAKSIFLTLIVAVCFLGLTNANSFAQANDISLAQSFSTDQLGQVLIPLNEFRPFPKASNREAWQAIPKDIQEIIINKAEEVAELDIKVLPASVYLQFQRNGNRSNYQNIWYDRRRRLHSLVVAECIENKGRFLDPITDMIWAICEESSWTWSAHIGTQKAGVDLPDSDDQVVALFSAQTANSLAITEYLLGEQLDTVSPLIRKRIINELDIKILTPFLTKKFGWMGYSARANKDYPNNWNPWICSNVLITALLAEHNEPRRAQLVHHAMDCLDNFLTYYPYDGSCDEGPSYWGRAGASVFDSLEHLYSASNRKIDFYQNPLIQEIARFIYRAHVVDNYFICLGDCDARTGISNEVVYRFGKRINDKNLMALGAYGVDQDWLVDKMDGGNDLNRFLHLVLNGKELVQHDAPSQPLVRDVWLSHPNMQMMAARDREGSAEGFFTAAWGGHNAQSHNHNDVGNFILFVDGKPLMIDIGRPTYTRQTFSSRRYEIWAFQSAFHNLPTINGVDQKAGRQYAADQVSYDMNDKQAHIVMDIASAYPKESDAKSWKRKVTLQRNKELQIVDDYQLNEPSSDIVENFIIAGQVIKKAPGKLILNDRQETVQALMEYDPQQLSASIETIELKDGKLRHVWGDQLYRIQLKTKNKKNRDTLAIRVVPVKK